MMSSQFRRQGDAGAFFVFLDGFPMFEYEANE
ncbi:hypothetical protein PEC301899_28580 [Pectobacterium carotovorum subsp. carotovorum]|nr:hypothetical protein PEC301899_28580 [Pectobacterium carotovorum subsp. carotovorum]